MYKRALLSRGRFPYRRFKLPKDQKSLKWLQHLRRTYASPTPVKKYSKHRRWPQLRTYNRWLHLKMLDLSNMRAAQKHFRSMRRVQPRIGDSGFQRLGAWRLNRFDVITIILQITPTVRWARCIIGQGPLRVNHKVIVDPEYYVEPKSSITWQWEIIRYYQLFFRTTRN